MAADPARRAVFIDSVVAFMQKFGFEGLDFDWEYPGFFDGSDPENDRDNFSQLVKEIAETLHPLGYILTAAVSPGYEKVHARLAGRFLSRFLNDLVLQRFPSPTTCPS